MFSTFGSELQDVDLTLYTDTYVIRGEMTTRHRRLSDLLNLNDDEFLVLSNATMDPLDGQAASYSAPYAQVNLAAVLFAVASDAVAAQPELRTPKVAEATLVSIPPFSVTGRIHLLPEREIRDALQELHGRFLPVTEATFWSEVLSVAPTTAPMLAVNHARAQILSPYTATTSGR
ncbi:MAG: hypothetical protein ABI573_01075 [Chloroflexota bacterium]